MASFIKWITGAARRERRWTEAPRQLSDHLAAASPDSFMLGQEYQHAKEKHIREYEVAEFRDGYWITHTWTCDLKKKTLRQSNGGVAHSSLLLAVASMRQYEYWKNDCGKIPLETPGSESTYRKLALKSGIQFRADGAPYRPDQDSGLKHNVLLSGDAFKSVFKETARTKDDKWRNLLRMTAVSISDTADINEIIKSPGFERYAFNATRYLKSIEKLEERFAATGYGRGLDRKLLPELNSADYFMAESAKRNVLRLAESSAIRATAYAAAGLYETALSTDRILDSDVLDWVERGSREIEIRIARTFCKAELAQGIGNAILQPRPDKPLELPLRVFLKKHYADFETTYAIPYLPTDEPRTIKRPAAREVIAPRSFGNGNRG